MQASFQPVQGAGTAQPALTATPLARIEQLFKEFKEMPDNNTTRQQKIDKLHEAYDLSLSQIQTGDPTIMARLSMILGEFGIMLYGKTPQYPGRTYPEVAEFMISKQVLLGALQAFLVRIKADSMTCDFKADLKQMPVDIMTQAPFASVEAPFVQASKDSLITLARDANLTDSEKLHFSRFLRYLNGAARHIISCFEERQMNDQDKKLVINSLYLARDFARVDDKEYWELMYNDWADVLKAEGNWNADTEQRHIAWLLDNATNDSQRARVLNKFFRNVEGSRKSLATNLQILQRKLAPQDYDTLRAVIEGKELDPAKIVLLAQKMRALDLKDKDYLSISWFAIVPSNLAHFLMIENSNNIEEIEGLLRLAMAIVEPERKEGHHNFNFKAIQNNWNAFALYLEQSIRQATVRLRQVKQGLQPTQQLSPAEILTTLRTAKETALLAKQAFEAYTTPIPELAAIVSQRLNETQEQLTNIETILAKFPVR